MNEQQCPICGGQNQCNVTEAKNCWCMRVKIPQALLDEVPKDQQSCICPDCVKNYIKKMKTPKL